MLGVRNRWERVDPGFETGRREGNKDFGGGVEGQLERSGGGVGTPGERRGGGGRGGDVGVGARGERGGDGGRVGGRTGGTTRPFVVVNSL